MDKKELKNVQDKLNKFHEREIAKALEKHVVSKAKDPAKAKEWFKNHVIVTKA